jgi:uncharacterized phage-associated protein
MLNKEKYGNVILYLCNELGGKIEGKKKLAKLLYYVDFDHFQYKESMKSITGDTYIAQEMGPVPAHLDEMIDYSVENNLIKAELVSLSGSALKMTIFYACKPTNLALFLLDEQLIITTDAKRLGHFSGAQLAGLTHNEAPWGATPLYSEIDYELAFYREDKFDSVNLV